MGESQSAFALTTYVNGVQPLAQVYDGFLVHSRGGSCLPLGSPGAVTDLASSIGGPGKQIRTDGAAPVLVLVMEGDVIGVLGYLRARQPDSERRPRLGGGRRGPCRCLPRGPGRGALRR